MNTALVVDIGNTRQKMAVFRNGRLIKPVAYALPSDAGSISRMLKKSNADHVLISSVHRSLPGIRTKAKVIAFSATTPVPIKNKYRTRFTLGSDRLAAAVAAAERFAGKNVLVIDAGTCIKFNFVNAKGEYLGGSIAPGLAMRFHALHNFTARLPFINQGIAPLTGNSTETSIRSGVMNGALNEVKGMIGDYRAKYGKLQIIITGGDADYFVKRLKMRIFARPELVLEGLYAILKFNAGKSTI